MGKTIDDIDKQVAQAVSHYWRTRKAQKEKQRNRGVSDAGLRSAVTGGAQMDGFITLFKNLI
ncbi:MAG: PaeR7I family type II restriction endonuclease [Thermodesulfobacteriota bacterium]|nr:PaeR7I family type II restriction endonuclease [Thermodesulfobacteriota bacterium]